MFTLLGDLIWSLFLWVVEVEPSFLDVLLSFLGVR